MTTVAKESTVQDHNNLEANKDRVLEHAEGDNGIIKQGDEKEYDNINAVKIARVLAGRIFSRLSEISKEAQA